MTQTPPPPPLRPPHTLILSILVLRKNYGAMWVVPHKHRVGAEILPSEKSSPEWPVRAVSGQSPVLGVLHLPASCKVTAACGCDSSACAHVREGKCCTLTGHSESFAPSATSGMNFILSYSCASLFSIFPSPEAGATEVKLHLPESAIKTDSQFLLEVKESGFEQHWTVPFSSSRMWSKKYSSEIINRI